MCDQTGVLPRNRAETEEFIGSDGLPHVGRMLEKGDPFYATIVVEEQFNKIHKYKGEPARVEKVWSPGSGNVGEEVKTQESGARAQF